MRSYNELSLNNGVLDKMLITPWNFNYHNDGNTWIFMFESLRWVNSFRYDSVWYNEIGRGLQSWPDFDRQMSPGTLELAWKLSGSQCMQLTEDRM